MKKISILLVAMTLFFSFVGCGYSEEHVEETRSEAYDEGYKDGYEDGLESADFDQREENQEEQYIEEILYYETLCERYGHKIYDEGDDSEEVCLHYENLCDEYGYLTYEMVYYPERWRYYVEYESDLYHCDWLCEDLNRNGNYFCTANPTLFYNPCQKCQGEDVCYLDEEAGVFHINKWHLDLGTNDFISPKANYQYVHKESAVAKGYEICSECNMR